MFQSDYVVMLMVNESSAYISARLNFLAAQMVLTLADEVEAEDCVAVGAKTVLWDV